MSVAGMARAVRESVSGLPREFWWLWTSTLVNRLGAFVSTFMAMYLTVERGYSAAYAGLVASLYGLGSIVAAIGAGVMADRLGRRPTLVVAQASTAVSVALLGFMEHPVAIAAVACLVGVASNASRPAVLAMMADLLPPEDRVRAFSLNYWALNLGFALSAAGAGFVAEYSYLAGFLGEAVLTMVCAVLVFVKIPETRPAAEGGVAGAGAAKGDPGGEPSVGLGTVLRDGRFMSVVGLSFLVSLVLQQGGVALPIVMGEEGFSSSDYGTVIALNGLLIVALQIPVTRFIQHREPRGPLVVSALLAGYGFGLTAFAGSSMALYAVAVLVWTLGEMINSPTEAGLVARLSPTRGRGRYQGMYTMAWGVAAMLAPLVSGTVIDRLGAGWLWALCAAIGSVAAVGFWVLLRRLPMDVVENQNNQNTVLVSQSPTTGGQKAEAQPA
ncbi:MDR family MFS transporter [Streptomyces sp. NPDC050504]|uniref:MDR family MFS transporter n=1 Tax=Streptomyces sp. NPDC050504 TaxID=3365618 RepID=UPI00379B0EEB